MVVMAGSVGRKVRVNFAGTTYSGTVERAEHVLNVAAPNGPRRLVYWVRTTDGRLIVTPASKVK
jgi:hypothetical protein